MRISFIVLLLFLLSRYQYAVGQNSNVPAQNFEKNEKFTKDSLKKEEKKFEAKEIAKTEKFLKKLKKKLSFVANSRAKEQKRIDAIIKAFVTDANLLSGANLKKINDSLTKINISKLDSLGVLIASLKQGNQELANKMGLLSEDIDLLTESIPEPAEELEMDKLVEKMIPLIKEKAKEEELKEKKEKKLKIIRNLISNPNGVVDTMEVNDSISKVFTLRLKKKEVFGFHPYWRNVDYYRNYNFTALSALIYYGFEIDPNTGLFKSTHGWEEQKVTDYAKKENCRVYIGVYSESDKGIKTLLDNNTTQEKFINTLIEKIQLKNADGVNLIFGSPPGKYRLKFQKFIKLLNNKLIDVNSNYKITLTIPVLDKNSFYDIKSLSNDVEYFIIDFTKKNIRGPIVPITGTDYSLASGISRYLNFNIPPEKFIACFPYHGVVWDAEGNREFLNYITYSEIGDSYTNEYGFTYDNGTQRSDVVFDKVDTLEQVWFDDARTLSEKYDYALEKNLSGVGVWALGDDNFKTDLWEALLDKMFVIDTTNVIELKKTIQTKQEKTFWEKIKHEFHLYALLFQHPCDFDTFDDGKEISRREEMLLDNYINYVALGAFILLLAVGIYSIYKNRTLGDDWNRRKMFLTILIILTLINMVTILMFFFLNPDFIGFGPGSNSNNCEVNFLILLKLLGVGFLLGGFSMRLLVMPLIKKKEIP